MMTDEAVAEAMVDEPGRTLRALKAMAAAAAEREGRVATAIEEQQRLLAFRHRLGDRRHELRRHPSPRVRPIDPQIDRLDVR